MKRGTITPIARSWMKDCRISITMHALLECVPSEAQVLEKKGSKRLRTYDAVRDFIPTANEEVTMPTVTFYQPRSTVGTRPLLGAVLLLNAARSLACEPQSIRSTDDVDQRPPDQSYVQAHHLTRALTRLRGHIVPRWSWASD